MVYAHPHKNILNNQGRFNFSLLRWIPHQYACVGLSGSGLKTRIKVEKRPTLIILYYLKHRTKLRCHKLKSCLNCASLNSLTSIYA